ncbi:hypothetical protein BUALT_Bualt09G0094100 [Buddleja alternifolia]|uniref:carbonic anhydrase n=1 Tax=Buddleja alternifolia TaxID=168488 RepID=A0AAV6X9B9_9LAMI|nr:hypothetical protein BUALT_Bualt09G0094100 [Buddleja alternifolia]
MVALNEMHCSRYSVTVVPEKEIPSDQYALGFAGFKLKETSKLGPRPEKPIEIYEFESCPFCRKVREIVAVLDLDVLYYPCPRNGPNFRPKVAQMGGKQQFPYMVDPNTGVSMYESDEIIKYLVGKYGDGNVPFLLSLGLLTTLSEGFAMIGRMGKGSSYTPSKLPPKPLEIWAYEASPFCKVVRELLVELELPHILHSCARGSPKRQILYQRVGHFQSLVSPSSSLILEPKALTDGEASTNFSTCSDGKSQSPINILKGKVVFNNTLKPLISSYDSANVTLVNNEFSVGLHYPEHSGGLIVDGKMYNLEQIHWHTPSEHQINGLQYAAELHLVHVSEDKNVSVVAVLFKYGPPDPLVAKIQNKLNELATYKAKRREEAPITIGYFHSKLLSKRARKYYRYIGSFTTPPCSENVVWHVLGKVRSISREQVEALKAPLDKRCKNNARP